MTTSISLIAGNVIGVLGRVIAAVGGFRRRTIAPGLSADDELHHALARILRRRRITACVVALASGLFLVGINFLRNPSVEDQTLLPAAVLWAAVLILLMLMVILALTDLRAVGRIRKELQKRVSQQFRQSFCGPGAGEDHPR